MRRNRCRHESERVPGFAGIRRKVLFLAHDPSPGTIRGAAFLLGAPFLARRKAKYLTRGAKTAITFFPPSLQAIHKSVRGAHPT
jgi:hypothetical protein